MSETVHDVLEAVGKLVILKYIFERHMTRAEAVTHNTTFTNCSYGDKLTPILDGILTYRLSPKSSEYKPQRSSYLGQKHHNLSRGM